MSIDKNIIFTKTLIFLCSISVIFLCEDFLGPTNLFVGIAISQGAIMLLDKDLTGNPIRNTIKYLVIMMYLGIFPFIASLNIYLGLIINFLAIFFIAYTLVYDLKISTCFPFILIYLLLLIKPTSVEELPLRILGLLIGAFYIMAVQFLINGTRCKIEVNKALNNVIDNLRDKIEKIINNKSVKDIDNKISNNINVITVTIYEKKSDYFYLNDRDNFIINIVLCLERLGSSLDDLTKQKKENHKKFLDDLSVILKELSYSIKDRNSLEEFKNKIKKFIIAYEKYPNEYYIVYEILQCIDMIEYYINNRGNIKKYKQKHKNKLERIQRKFKINNILKLYFNKSSLKFTYAFRVSFLLSISYFIVQLFHLEYGRWITFTLFALIQPYSEITENRSHLRFKGTVIGIIIFTIIDIIIRFKDFKIFIILCAYYMYICVKQYDKKITCITVIVLGMISIGNNNLELVIFNRFIYISIGIIIANLGTKYIFPYSSLDSIKKFIINDYELSKKMISKGCMKIGKADSIEEMNKFILLSKLIENKIVLNSSGLNEDIIRKFVYNERILNNNIYFLFYNINKYNLNNKIIDEICYILKQLSLQYNNTSLDKKKSIGNIKDNIKLNFQDLNEIKYKLIYINLYRIAIRMENSNTLITYFLS